MNPSLPEEPTRNPYAPPQADGPVAKPRPVYRTPPPRILQRVVIAALVLNGVISISTRLRSIQFTLEWMVPLGIVLGVWGLMIWKIRTRPRRWGLPVGILLCLIIAFQFVTWWQMRRMSVEYEFPLRPAYHWGFVLGQIPIVIAAVGSILLRFRWPVEEKTEG